jgi:hypothetical protein
VDNCPDTANADQSDTDLELIGNVCDPFPENRDNEQVQCDQDLAQALGDVVTCGSDLGQCQDDLDITQTSLAKAQTDLGVCQTDLNEKETALTQALATIDAMRLCLAHYKKENGVRCRDGKDNDCDGLTDGDDSDCAK